MSESSDTDSFRIVPQDPLPIGSRFEVVFDTPSDKYEILLRPAYTTDSTPEIVTIPFEPVDHPKLITESCPSDRCCADIGCEKFLRLHGKENWLTLLQEVELHVPNVSEVLKMSMYDLVTQAQSICIRRSLLTDFAEVPRVTIPVCPKPYVCVDANVWRDYLSVDARVASNVSLKFYDQTIGELRDFSPPGFKGFGANLKNSIIYKIPITFNKFAWMFLRYGYVTLEVDGSYPMNRPVQGTTSSIFEIGAAPYGAAMAALESGIVAVYCVTNFKGESNRPIPTRYVERMLDFSEKFGGHTDLNGIVDFIEVNPDLVYLQHSMVILDLPLHRNSGSAHSGAGLRADNDARQALEFVDDIPLGKVSAMASRLKNYKVILDKMLVTGGSAIIKLLEYASSQVLEALYFLTVSFSTVVFVRNPYSKTLSQEIYVVCGGFRQGHQIFDEFSKEYCRFANIMIYRHTAALLLVAQRKGMNFKMPRTICCRRNLFRSACVSFDTVLVKVYSEPLDKDNRLNSTYLDCEKADYEFEQLRLYFPAVHVDQLRMFYPRFSLGDAVDQLMGSGYQLDKKYA